MPTLQEILQDQNYINANPATKKAIFDRWSALDTNYTGANPATQQAIRSRFGVGGIEAEPPAEPPKDKGFFSNVGSLLVEGGKRAIGSAQVSPSVIAGDVSEDKAKLLSEQLSMKPSVQPKELVEAQTAFKDEAEAFEKAKGFTESVGPFAGFLLEFGKQVITNPKGAVYLTAQSAANMAPQIAGMIAGGKGAALAASPAGPQVAALAGAAGAVGGGFAAGVPLEIGSEFIGRIGEKLAERGLEPTEENIAALLRDKAVVEQAISEARTKGVTTAAVDSLMTVGAGKFASGPRRAAIETARKEMGATADAAKLAARADEILKARTMTQKVGRGAGAVGIETAGGGISEAAGQAAAYGKVDLEDVGAEMLGELGGSAASVPAAAYSTTQDMLKSKAKTDAAKILADEEQARLDAEAEEKAKVPPLALGDEGVFTPVALPDGSVAMTREELNQYEADQFRKKYEPQKAEEPEREVLALSDQGVFKPTPLPDGSVAMTREDLEAYEEQQFRKKYEPVKVEQPPAPEPYVKPASISGTKPDTLLGERADPLASAVTARREAAEPKSEVPLTDDYAFLQREKQRLLQQDQTPDTKKLLGRIDERIGEVLKRDIERQRADAEAAKTSVFAQKELPPVESRDVVVGNLELGKLQAPERLPDQPLTSREIKSAEKMRTAPPPVDDAQARLEQAEMDRRKFMRSKEAKQGNLMDYLKGKLALDEVSDIAPKGKGFEKLANEKGTYISELVSDGMLDEFLPPDQRAGQANFDAQTAAETIKENLRNKNLRPFELQMQIRQLDESVAAAEREAKEPSTAQFDLSEVEPGEAASVERAAGDQAVGEVTDIRYQRSTTGGKSIGKQQTQSVVDAVKSQWSNAPEVVVAESMDDTAIPEAVRAHNKEAIAKGAKGSPKGFFYKGKAYILADSMTSANDAVETLFHESLGHYGLRGTFGPEMGKVLADVVKNRKADVEAKAKQYGLDVNSKEDMLEAAEEVLAEMAQTKPGLSFVKRAIAVIRNFLRDLGLPFKMSNEDIIQKYILPARAFVEKGERRAAEGKPAAMREETPVGEVRYQRDSITGKPILAQWGTPTDTKIAGDIGKDDIIYSLQNKMIDTKRVVDAITATAGKIAAKWNPYLQEELYHGRTAKQTKDFLTEELRPLMQAMEKAGVNIADMEEYLKNRHAIAYNEQVAKVNPKMPDKGSGIATADAQAYLNGLSPADKAKYEALAKRVDQITKGTRKLLVDSGLETQETIDNWEKTFPFYVPLKRGDIDYAYTASGMGTGQGFDVRGDFSRRAMGSEREATDVLANIAMMRERAIVKSQKNRVAQALFGLAAQNPNPQFWLPVDPMAEVDPANMQELLNFGLSQQDLDFIAKEPRQKAIDKKRNEVVERINATLRGNENVLSMRFNGQDRYVFFNPNDPRSQRMAKSMKNLDADQLGSILGPLSTITRWMAAVNTQYNPIFGAYNFLRDVQGAALQLSDTPLAKDRKAVVGGTLPALKGIYAAVRAERSGTQATGPWAALWEEFQQEGGQTGFRDQFSRSQERAEALQKELNKITEGKVKTAGRAVIDWLSDYNDSMENAVRLSAYKAALDKGIDKQEAASIAKNLTVNFNRKGQIGVQAGALYAFFNAAVQGTTRLAQTLKGPAGKKIIAGGLLLGTMQAALLAAYGYDEEEPPEFVRERNLIIPLEIFGIDDKYIAFPMPLGYHVIPGTSRILTEWALSGFKDTPERIASLTGMFLEAFNPIGNAGWSAQTLAPTFADPIVALTENKDWTGKPIARKDFSNLDPTPGYTRSKEATNIVFKKIAEYLNLASGGTDFQPGVFSPTPDQIEYLFGQATGGLGREIAKGITTVEKTITGEELPSYKIPLAGRFYGETKSSAAESGRFYKNMEKLNKHENEIKGRRESKQPLGDYLKDNPEARLAPMARKVYNDVRELRKRREALIERNAPKESVQAVEKMITRKMQVLNDRVRALEERN